MNNGRFKEFFATRNAVAIAGTVILGVIGLMGMMMGWSLYFISFSTYPYFFQLIFSLGTAAIIEGSLFWFGIQLTKAAATMLERGWAIGSAVIVLIIIGLNVSAHNAIARGAQLAGWQEKYVNYFGPAVIIVIAGLVIVQLLFRPELQARFRDSMREFQVKKRVDDIEDEILNGPEFEKWMKDKFKEQMFIRAAGRTGYVAEPESQQAPPAPEPQQSQQSFQPPTVDGEIVQSPEPPRQMPWMPYTAARALQEARRSASNGAQNGSHNSKN